MKNISRTTLRELKKRYLNVLKKCFLANLMAFGMITLATPATAVEDRLDVGSGETKEYNSIVTFEDLVYSDDGGAISNEGTITFGESSTATFTNNSGYNGGAIYNKQGTITFSENLTVTFSGNETSGNYSYGGAIYNDDGTITFGENSTATFTGNWASYEGGAINNTYGTIMFGGDTTFTNNRVSSIGGAIYNYKGTITFGGEATFTNNSAYSGNGGAIYNNSSNSTITFGADSSVSFSNNTANGYLNDIYNSGTINILGEVKSDIHLVSKGGTIGLKAKKTKDTDTDGKITYTGSYKLTDTTLDLSGDGAKEVTIENLTVGGSSTLKWDAEIKDAGDSYTVTSDVLNLTATGQFTAGTVNIMGGNKGEWYDVTLTDLYNTPLISGGGSINYTIDGLYKTKNVTETGFSVNFVALPKTLGEVLRSTTASTLDFGDYVTVNEGETLNYGISEKDLQNGSMGELGSGEKIIRGATKDASDTVINAIGVSKLFNLGSGDKLTLENLTISNAKGAIYNNSGTITFGGDATFTGNSASSNEFGGAIYNENGGTITFGENSTTTFTDNTAFSGGAIYNYNNSTITFGESSTATFTGNSASSSGIAIYNSGTITFGESSTATFTDNSTSSSGSGTIYNDDGTITFGKSSTATFTGNSAYNGGAISNHGTITFAKDTTATFTSNSSTTYYTYGGAIDNSGPITFGGDATFERNSAIATSNGYSFGGAISTGGSNAQITFNGDATFTGNSATATRGYSFGGAINNNSNAIINFNNSFTFTNNKTISKGVETPNDILNSATINFNHGLDENNNPLIGTLDGGIRQDLGNSKINKTGAGTLILGDNMDNGYSTRYTSQFTQSAGLTIAHADKLTFAETNTITGGELKTHGAEINHNAVVGKTLDDEGNVVAVGSAVHYTNLEEMEINKETVAGVQYAGEDLGATIGFGSYTKAEKDAEIALMKGRIVSYTDDKGTEDTSDDEVVTYLASDKLFTTGTLEEGKITHFKVTEALDNEKGNIIAFRNASVEIDSHIGNTGATYELDNSVLESNSVANKVIANNMKVGGSAQEVSFKELEIKEGTILDIDNKHVTADKVTFGKESTLSVTLNHLADHGTLSQEEVAGDEEAKLVLKLTEGLDQEEGIYQVFNKDNNLALEKNGLIDVIDMQDGSYKVAKKSVETLSQELGTTKEESTVANALLSGNSEKEEFVKVQTELLEALQSENKATFARGKKALNALGARSTSIYQSQATAQFTQMHTVITQMLMNSTAPVFGHAGGEEPARATVYVKGLYDRVNSLAGDGFRMRSKGAVLGVQSAITEDLTVGIGYAGINTIAKEPLRRTEVDTNTGFISAQYQPNNWWVNGVLTYSRSQYDEEKNILSTKGIAKYDVDSLGAQITTGYNIKRGNWIVTPEVGVRYLNARQEGYVDSLGTTVEKTTSDFVTTMAGFKVGVDLGWMRPLAGVMVGYDVVTDDISAVNTLASGATYTIKGKALDRLSTTVVAGFAADIGDNATLKLEYSGNYRKEYLDHSGMLRLEWRF